MKEISNLIAYRPDVKVVDATLRDGGLVNNFYFTDEFVKALYLANLRAGVDYMEFGYKASKEDCRDGRRGQVREDGYHRPDGQPHRHDSGGRLCERDSGGRRSD